GKALRPILVARLGVRRLRSAHRARAGIDLRVRAAAPLPPRRGRSDGPRPGRARRSPRGGLTGPGSLAPSGPASYNPGVIPLRDPVPSRTAPLVTVGLIAVNVLVFLHETAVGPYLPQLIQHYGLVPYTFVHWGEQFGSPLDPARFLPLFTSMFWHGGWLHLIG